mgnify:CR=1 FL=1
MNRRIGVLTTVANPKRATESDEEASSSQAIRSYLRWTGNAHAGAARKCPAAGGMDWRMARVDNSAPREAFTFDDVLLRPGRSEILPSQADIRTRITREIALNIPIVASAMDTVTEYQMAIAMAQAGGLGVIHRNFEPHEQAAQVRQVKKFESGMVVNPVTINPEATLADALELMTQNHISGIPVVEGGGNGKAGKLVGILTNRDVRFATDKRQKVSELMTKENLVTVREGVAQDEAKRLLHQHRIEKLLVVDGGYRCVGLITVKDIEKAVANPNACKDEQGRLRVAAATTVGDKGFERTEHLIEAGVDLVHITYKGAGGGLNEVIGGQIQLMFSSLTSLAPHVASGRLRGIAIASLQRAAIAPQLPTIAESGLPGFEAALWDAVMVPTGTAPAIVERLNTELDRIVRLPEVTDQLRRQGFAVATMPRAALAAYIRSEIAKWRSVVEKSGARAD